MAVRGLRRSVKAVAAGTILALVATACSNSSSSVSGGGGSAPGVTSNSITVGSLATLSGALSAGFGDIVYGAKAYFAMINAQGGVNGRKINLKYTADDAGSPSTDEDQARNLVQQDNVFAIVGVGTPFFSANQYLGQTGTPTFGYVVSNNWNTYPNLFGAYGSTLDYSTGATAAAFVAKQLHSQAVGLIAYGAAAQSKDACTAYAQGMKQQGVNVAFQDLNLGIYADPTPDVQQMAAHHVDQVLTCVDGPENLKIVQTMQQYGLGGVHSIWLNGYDRGVVAQHAAAMNGVIFSLQSVPFEAAQAFPGKYPGMQQYIATMNKYEPKWTYDDISLQGYINAAQFVSGLRAAGKNPTQQSVVKAINSETAFNAGGLMSPVNWTQAHKTAPPPYCSSYVEVGPGGKLAPAFVQHGDQALICFNKTSDVPLPLPAHTPPSS